MKTSTSYVQKFRARRKAGKLLLPRLEMDNAVADDLVEAGFLGEWDSENPQAIAEAILKFLKSIENIAEWDTEDPQVIATILKLLKSIGNGISSD